MPLKARYAILFLAIIVMGLLSRQWTIIPVSTGDFLYAVMVYCGSRYLLTNKSLMIAAVLSLVFCFLIECSQLLEQQETLTYIRSFKLGRLILGQGFLWSDLLAYFLGVLSIFLIDRRWINR